jgi:UDP-glucose:(heptosyl)LPS alpha-1,3-glucosyltransferase
MTMDIAFCYEKVVPARGGCETYISDLARRLARDGHAVHIYARDWDAAALPPATHFHRIDPPKGPRFLRPWRFAAACEKALANHRHDVTIGFDKTWGQDVLYPQGGLHAATVAHNRIKYADAITRLGAGLAKWFDPATWSFSLLERKQYLGRYRPVIVVNSRMVRGHFEQFYGVPADRTRIVPNAIDPTRFHADDRPRRRHAERDAWGIAPDASVGLFVGMNYRLKGLAPLIRSLVMVPKEKKLTVAVVGHRDYAEYAKLAESLGVADRVRFLGFRADPKDAYFASDFLIHPTFYDPCSLVVLEALACGLPVVTTRFNGAGELIDNTAGLIINDPLDTRALGGAITTMCDPQYRVTAAKAARECARRWTFEDHYRSLLAVFAEVYEEKMKKAA